MESYIILPGHEVCNTEQFPKGMFFTSFESVTPLT